MKLFTAMLCIIALAACAASSKFKKDEAAFNASKTISSFKAIADLNDSYFDIKENNFFEFYHQLFDSVKNTRYPGKYSKHGDTLYLTFYNKKGVSMLGNKAIIHAAKKEIVFFK